MNRKFFRSVFPVVKLMLFGVCLYAQDTTSVTEEKPANDKRPVKDVFDSNWLINTQTMIVPMAKTLELDINHRFGQFKNEKKDMWGLYAPSNIRLGLTFTPVKNLQVGAGMTKEQMMYDFNVKWNPLQQTRSGSFPVFITYVGNLAIEGGENSVNWSIQDISGNDSIVNKKFPVYTDRFSYFNQLLIGRKFHDRFSLQVAASYMHYNLIDSMASKGIVHDNLTLSAAGRVKFYGEMSILFEYFYPLTPAEDIKPDFGIGFEANTSAHAFQLFISPYTNIINQRDVVFNKKDPRFISDYSLGFNVTRLWNF